MKELIGKDLATLISQIREQHPDLSQEELALMLGYYNIEENGQRTGNVLALLDALIEQKISKKFRNKAGAKPKFELLVQKDGKIILGKAYTEGAGLRPGTKMKVAILEKGKILLHPTRGKSNNAL